jgi:hypothetical protein
MPRNPSTRASTQRQRTAQNPLLLGTFSETSIRYLQGTLGPTNKPNRGGHGGGTYNHWFKIKNELPAWIITVKGGGWEKYLNVSAYDINKNPIVGRGIFDDASIQVNSSDGSLINPYVGHVMAAGSDLYNKFNPARLDKGDERYYPLGVGEYLISVSTTLNQPIDYELGIVIEIYDKEGVVLLEDYSKILWEDEEPIQDYMLLDTTPNYEGDDDHEHSLTEWETAWVTEFQEYRKFPSIFAPLTTKP